ncbi:peptide ABC transporter substrate-binding protein [Pseudochrobactrum kiredjianiae]|uniref:Peptide ABC transporter substrate-binding protein n=1 Tax=Pseudochrobactrum kiredjianiae TaxID=386305 RepID=A0ABW3V5N6_9HYPH|nr:peptide ABC transporter substrate-binding protein [Pseudochrobactrum kiredjianiae]MDM7850687.1 peptide ABC transporter substrate-binding protein [Pseudochrobactrum kiredjianiae]
MYRKILLAGVCALTLTGALASVASAEVVLNRGNDTDPATLDHHRTSTVSEGRIMADLYDGLVRQSAKGEAVAATAKSWDISEDGLVYTFHLRDDAKWSNGDKVTAGDFLFTFHRIMDPKTAAGYASMLFPIKNAEEAVAGKKPLEELGVEAVDDLTLKITLKSPTPYFLELLTHQTGLPMHPKSIEENGDKFTTPGKMVTNGAYQLVSFTPNDKIVMKKNPNFYDADQVKIDVVNWIPFEDRASCMRRFEAKEVQICSDVPSEQMDYVKNKLAKEFHIAPYLGSYYLPVKGKTADSKLKDPRVREAISMAIDREFMAEQVWQGTMLPAYSVVPPGIANYVEGGVKAEYAGEDMLEREDKAKALLKEAGVEPNTLSIELLYNTSENHKNTMAAVADMLSNIGIKATLNETEGATYFNFLREDGPFDIARAGWIGDYNDPQNFLFLSQSGVSFNYSKWKNADYDALMAKAEVTTDLKARAEILADAERLLLKETAVIPVLYYSSRALVSENIEGWYDNLMDAHATRWLSLKQ